MIRKTFAAALCGLALSHAALAADSMVKVTPLGSMDGEFCSRDRALVFEDPNGTRILYDAGRTVAGAQDPRLGDIDVILVSHMHGDHLGDQRIKLLNAGTCAKPETPIKTLPNSNTVEIAIGKGAKIVTGSEMPGFFAKKLAALGGDPKNSVLARFGSSVKVGGVAITTVPAVHSNGLSPGFLSGPMAEHLRENGVNASVGPATGYVLTFSNGLVVYLSGDTGITAEQELVVHDYYHAKLAVMNIGDTYTTGPQEAAHVINEMVKPSSVIASHANEAATEGGTVIEGTRTDTFIKATKVPVYVPLSGKTMEFDSKGICQSGCRKN